MLTLSLILVIALGALSIAYGVITAKDVLSRDPGTPRMQEIATAIQEGASAYLKRQYGTIAIVGVVLFVLVAWRLGLTVAVGFAIGAVTTGVFLGLGILSGGPAFLLLTFALCSLIAWFAPRRTMGVRAGQVKVWDKDINDN